MSRSFLALLLVPAALATAQDLKPINLPAPRITGGKPLMEALKARKSTREFAPDKIPMQTLSNLLWAGWGINREDGSRTAPSASNRQEIDVYVVMENGAFMYDAKANVLKPVASGDLRKLAGQQPFVAQAPLNLVYVGDLARWPGDELTNKINTTNVNTGFIAENVYLFCASEGLATVIRAMVPKEELAKALHLTSEQHITLSQTIGYFKK
jgi:nitroreductase